MDPLEEISNFWGIPEYLFPADWSDLVRVYLVDYQSLDFLSRKGSGRSRGARVPLEPV